MKTKYLRCKTCGGHLYKDPGALLDEWLHSGATAILRKKAASS